MSLSKNLVIVLTFFCITEKVFAADIIVTKLNDTLDGACDSDCSLREAVVLANSLPGEDHIKLSAGTYVVDINLPSDEDYGLIDEDANINGDLDITDSVTITGSTVDATIIDGANNDRIFDIISGSTLLSNVTLTNGKQTEYGGAIQNHSTLTIRNSAIVNNRSTSAFSAGIGGGIANFGTLNVSFCTISDNFASAGEGSRGSGGGIYNEGNLIVRDSTFRNNRASDDDDSGSGAGIYNKGTADIRRSLFTEHFLQTNGYGAAIITLDGGSLKLVSSTISNNSAGEFGKGAIANGKPSELPGKLYLTNLTIVDNANFGIYTKGFTYIRNSIISGNYRLEDGLAQNCHSENGIIDERDTLMGEGNNPGCWTNFSFNNNKTFTTLLDVLADNGGPTLTHAVRNNSVAIDRVQQSQCPTTDQRNEPTYVDGDGDGIARCDLGAVEYRP